MDSHLDVEANDRWLHIITKRRVECFTRETSTALTEFRVSLQYTYSQVEEKVNIGILLKNITYVWRKQTELVIDYEENMSRRYNRRRWWSRRQDVRADEEGHPWREFPESKRATWPSTMYIELAM